MKKAGVAQLFPYRDGSGQLMFRGIVDQDSKKVTLFYPYREGGNLMLRGAAPDGSILLGFPYRDGGGNLMGRSLAWGGVSGCYDFLSVEKDELPQTDLGLTVGGFSGPVMSARYYWWEPCPDHDCGCYGCLHGDGTTSPSVYGLYNSGIWNRSYRADFSFAAGNRSYPCHLCWWEVGQCDFPGASSWPNPRPPSPEPCSGDPNGPTYWEYLGKCNNSRISTVGPPVIWIGRDDWVNVYLEAYQSYCPAVPEEDPHKWWILVFFAFNLGLQASTGDLVRCHGNLPDTGFYAYAKKLEAPLPVLLTPSDVCAARTSVHTECFCYESGEHPDTGTWHSCPLASYGGPPPTFSVSVL